MWRSSTTTRTRRPAGPPGRPPATSGSGIGIADIAVSLSAPAFRKMRRNDSAQPRAALLGLVEAVVPNLRALLVAGNALKERLQRSVHVEVVAILPAQELWPM